MSELSQQGTKFILKNLVIISSQVYGVISFDNFPPINSGEIFRFMLVRNPSICFLFSCLIVIDYLKGKVSCFFFFLKPGIDSLLFTSY